MYTIENRLRLLEQKIEKLQYLETITRNAADLIKNQESRNIDFANRIKDLEFKIQEVSNQMSAVKATLVILETQKPKTKKTKQTSSKK